MKKILIASLIAGIIFAVLGFNWNLIALLKTFGIGFIVTLISILISNLF